MDENLRISNCINNRLKLLNSGSVCETSIDTFNSDTKDGFHQIMAYYSIIGPATQNVSVPETKMKS